MNLTEKEYFDLYLKTLSPVVQSNIDIVTSENIDQNYLLHISIDSKIKQFIPRIGNRQGNKEDRTVARITAAPSLLGCLIGYAVSEYEFTNFVPDGKPENNNYKGGYYIYEIPFQYALKPNNRLVYDATYSDEYWLTSYSPNTNVYTPVQIGKLFIQSINHVSKNGSLPDAYATIFIEVLKEEGISFSKNIFLKKGYYEINGPLTVYFNKQHKWNKDGKFTVKEISSSDFNKVKDQSVSLLSIDNSIPTYLKW